MKRKISVIIPNYNNKIYLKDCFESLEGQTYKNFEVLFIDDGSSDDSIEWVQQFKETSKMDIIIIKQYNQNAAVARNKGIELANGEYCYFLDSDDIVLSSDIFEKIINDIDDNDILIGNYNMIDNCGKSIKEYECKSNILKYDNKYDYVKLSPVPSNKLYKTSIMKKNDIYFSNVRIGQDLNFFLKYLLFSEKIKIVDYDIYKYRILEDGMTNTKNIKFLDIFYSFEEIRKFYKKNNKEDEYNFYISPIALSHYHGQLSKVRFFNNYYKKRMIYTCIAFYVNSTKNKISIKNQLYWRELRIYYVKKILLKSKLYNLIKYK